MSRVQAIYQIDGLNRIPVETAKVGDIVCFRASAILRLATPSPSPAAPEAPLFVKISEPTGKTTFSVNDSPFCGPRR